MDGNFVSGSSEADSRAFVQILFACFVAIVVFVTIYAL